MESKLVALSRAENFPHLPPKLKLLTSRLTPSGMNAARLVAEKNKPLVLPSVTKRVPSIPAALLSEPHLLLRSIMFWLKLTRDSTLLRLIQMIGEINYD